MNAIAATPNAIYLGGSFSHVGPFTGPTGIDAVTGKGKGWAPLRSASAQDGPTVSDSASDGSGGFYVAGDIHVPGTSRSYLIHIRANGRIDRRFNPHPDAPVERIAVSGSTVYVAGENFTTIGGERREKLAALDGSTGAATDWNPSAAGVSDLRVRGLVATRSTVYIAGAFRQIGGEPRNGLAALDASTGAVRSWHPNVDDQWSALAISGSTLYVGGDGGVSRFAVVESRRKEVGGFDTDGPVFDLAVKGSRLYVGGRFSKVRSPSGHASHLPVPRSGLAAFNTVSNRLTAWDPSPDDGVDSSFVGGVTALAVSDSTVYAAGDFDEVRGKPRFHLAAIDRSSGWPTDWNPSADGVPQTLALSGSTLYVGGRLGSVGGQPRHGLAALKPGTGKLKPWNPQVDGTVDALDVRASTVYAGGVFREVDGKPQSNLAAIDAISGQAIDWDLDTNGAVRAIAATRYGVYIGGDFTSVRGEPHSNLALIDSVGGGVKQDWNPSVTTTKHYTQYPNFYPNHQCIGNDPCLFTLVDAIAVAGSRVYVGGIFDHVGGEPRDNIAALDATTGAAKSWRPDAEGGGNPGGGTPESIVSALRVSGPIVYAGGDFAQIGGEPRANLAAVKTADGSATNWDPSVSFHGGEAIISAIAVEGPNVYVGGTFDKVGATPRDNLAAIDASSGTATSWNPSAEFPQTYLPFYVAASSLALGPDGSLWAGGRFSFFPTAPAAGVARFKP